MQFEKDGPAGILKLLCRYGYFGKMGNGRIAP